MDVTAADIAGSGQRRLAVEELQAALLAAWRGDFTDGGSAAASTMVGGRPAAHIVNGREGGVAHGSARTGSAAAATASGMTGVRPACRAVVVLGAHAGAGASTVAVAVADALSDGGERVRLVDCADPRRSALAGVTSIELGVDAAGWRRGRRATPGGEVLVERLAGPASSVDAVPPPARGGPGWLVVDVGWPAWQAVDATGWVAALLASARLVLVHRPTLPGIRQAEHLLAELLPVDRLPVVACVGAARWPRVVTASCGPLLGEIHAAGRLVAMPVDQRVEVTGPTADPLPAPVGAAGRVLARLLTDHATSRRTA